jgi:hypothetical protein
MKLNNIFKQTNRTYKCHSIKESYINDMVKSTNKLLESVDMIKYSTIPFPKNMVFMVDNNSGLETLYKIYHVEEDEVIDDVYYTVYDIADSEYTTIFNHKDLYNKIENGQITIIKIPTDTREFIPSEPTTSGEEFNESVLFEEEQEVEVNDEDSKIIKQKYFEPNGIYTFYPNEKKPLRFKIDRFVFSSYSKKVFAEITYENSSHGINGTTISLTSLEEMHLDNRCVRMYNDEPETLGDEYDE